MKPLSPADQADLIKRYFPALLPYPTEDDPNTWKAPSTTTRGTEYTVAIGYAGEWECSCPATRTCKHIALVTACDARTPDAITELAAVRDADELDWTKVHATLGAGHGSIYRAESDYEGLPMS
jgi:hypothetical protein